MPLQQASLSFVTIRRQFDFRGIEMGRWVTPEERDRAAVNFNQALHDLMDALQGPEQLISLRGTLGLQFGKGGQRGVAAHYMPATRQLALAKNAGAGSLAHEWFGFWATVSKASYSVQMETTPANSSKPLNASMKSTIFSTTLNQRKCAPVLLKPS